MADDDRVTIRHKTTLEEKEVPKGALAFFVNDETEFEVLDSRGRVSGSATAAVKEK